MREETRTHDPNLFVHTADLHLAPRTSSILKRDPASGRLLRDIDMDTALVHAVDDVLQQDVLPSAFVISGDLFDTYNGSADAFITIVGQMRRLVDAGIAIIGIAGNHDTPTNMMKTSMFEMLQNVFAGEPLVTLAYDEVRHVKVGDVEYVLLPHAVCVGGEMDVAKLTPSMEASHSVLLVHGVAAGDPSLRQMDEAKEVPIASFVMDMPWDYIAFGHYHKPGWIKGYEGKAAYCGSLENTVVSGPDVCMRRGPVYVDMTKDGKSKSKMHPLRVRPIVKLPTIDVSMLDETNPIGIDKAIEDEIAGNEQKDAIVSLDVTNIARSQYKALPRRNFQSCDETALVVKVNFEYARETPPMDKDDETEETSDAVSEADDETIGTLDHEAEKTVSLLVGNGTIPESRKDDVLKELLALLAE